MAKTTANLGKLVYCMLADTWGWENNRFRARRFLTGMVIKGKMEEILANKLFQGDLIHFRPTLNEPHGFLSVVHGVDKRGIVHLGNINVTPLQMQMIDQLHLTGKI